MAMRFVYDADSIYFTEHVMYVLRHYGYVEASEDVTRVQAELEGEIPSLVAYGRRLLDTGGVEEAIRFLFFDPAERDNLARIGSQTLQFWRKNPVENTASVTEVVGNALQMVEDQDFDVVIPLNV